MGLNPFRYDIIIIKYKELCLSERRKRDMNKGNSKFTYIDVFAGAGGLSEGFAKLGFTPVSHVEMDKDACNTLKTRECYYYLKKHGKLQLYNDYLSGKISRHSLYQQIPTRVLDSVICATMTAESMNDIFSKIVEMFD